MRKMILLFVILLMLGSSARAQVITGPDRLPHAESPALNALLQEALAPVTEPLETIVWQLPGTSVFSVYVTYSTGFRAGHDHIAGISLLMDADNECLLSPADLFEDWDGFTAWLENDMEENIESALSDYQDTEGLLPLPLETASFGPCGMTLHYDVETYCLLSGRAGELMWRWDELFPWLKDAYRPLPQTAERMMAAAAEGRLPLVPIQIGDDLAQVLENSALLAGPDYMTDGELYETENADMREILLIAPRGADGSGPVTGIRTLHPVIGEESKGASLEDIRTFLGLPEASVALDAAAADYLRLARAALMDRYPCGNYHLELFYDADNALLAAQLRQN
ncbi:MAG: hypothetical protein MJ136_05340 [Clostridia bacterium]|nr:hypothetical protein [Clostridia bacterium]